MTSNDLKIQAFCKTFNEFLSQLLIIKPYDIWLNILSNTVSLLSSTTPKVLVSQFRGYTSFYSDHILNKNEIYFMADQFTKECDEQIGSWGSNEIKKIIMLWKDPSISYDEKQYIWMYLEALVKLERSITL